MHVWLITCCILGRSDPRTTGVYNTIITPPRSILFEYTLDPSSMLMTEARQKYCPYIMVLICPKECNLINN